MGNEKKIIINKKIKIKKPKFKKSPSTKCFFIFVFTYVHQISQKSVDK